jgi:hypothetical protein
MAAGLRSRAPGIGIAVARSKGEAFADIPSWLIDAYIGVYPTSQSKEY